MYLLYVDESGSTTDPNQQYFILSGIAVHEKQTYWIENAMNDIAARFSTETPINLNCTVRPCVQAKANRAA
ncbi:DUF3800 domain-containing protein [Kingella negevensis]|uniref:DUF3800 domain-containing protein n=1 Tax=Kingella negevensis TaxID=1522312 RepID=UPI00050A0F52|nr:DUF3800 domain-containing protein [Kingella negevensis]MDK4688425.1 DUF3800 domain-containing protein [Kingella negevensis]WII90317.1 DUF3800 domain-containing protein [Kingella negevensis]